MSELRRDLISGNEVIIAEQRAERPQEFAKTRQYVDSSPCPFCEGNERETPAELAALRPKGTPPNQPGWQVRVVPNKYPAVVPADYERAREFRETEATAAAASFGGRHEVIIESPKHLVRSADLSAADFAQIIRTYRDRLQAAKASPGNRFGIIFKNEGPDAGATIRHIHSQLVALPFLPKTARDIVERSDQYYRSRGECVFCDVLRFELSESLRIVDASEALVAFCPFAARVPYETWLIPRVHSAKFEEMDDDTANEVAVVLQRLLSGLMTVLDQPSFNFAINTAPFAVPCEPCYHWQIQIFPRLTTMAGFEWGTGCNINPVSPELAAQQLREICSARKPKSE